MSGETRIREFLHEIVEKADIVELRAILDLIGDEYFSPAEITEIESLAESDDWSDWREVRNDV